ncbi:hypothetical protein C4579_02170 [Candidatus Microgenomates bacterium]|nr:MAG: hypothetical protein C4579_02170 [Candidatus Microgenomates bacterium]
MKGGEIKMIKRIATAAASLSLLAVSAMPAFATSRVSYRFPSYDHGKTSETCIQEVEQSSYTDADIVLNVGANTGNNNASGNTGGNVSIHTGNASNTVAVAVVGGSNVANVPDCCCGNDEEPALETFSFKSKNKNASDFKKTEVEQRSHTDADILANVFANTGDNDAKWNTSGKSKYFHKPYVFNVNGDHDGSDVEIVTEHATNEVEVVVSGGSNKAK